MKLKKIVIFMKREDSRIKYSKMSHFLDFLPSNHLFSELYRVSCQTMRINDLRFKWKIVAKHSLQFVVDAFAHV